MAIFEAVRFALRILAQHWINGIKNMAQGHETPEAVWPKLMRLKRNWTYLMVGVPYSIYGALDNVAPEPKG